MQQDNKKRNVTIYDIAKEAGVSASVVSRAISGNGSVSPKSRLIIEKLVEKYHYTPNALARGLQKSKTKILGFMVPNIGNQYFSSVYYEFEKIAAEHGYMTLLCHGKGNFETESMVLRGFMEMRVEGIVIMGGRADFINLEETYIDEIRELNKKIPCVICSPKAERFGCIGVHGDEYIGVKKLIKHIYDQGFKSIGILSGSDNVYQSYIKKEYILEAVKEYGITIREEWIIPSSYNAASGRKSMEQLLKEKELPEMVFCMNDHVAVGAVNEILDRGLSIPKDIGITGYDGVEASNLSRPPITTVSPDYLTFGKILFDGMKALLEGTQFPPIHLIEPEIIVRDSTRKFK
ncbi:MAG: transcriptional regulator, LacI family [Anaerocolumna sp.]|jgi:DNA-binding LacI/PurR family transcriptional regulator|nr:transcriptional regulator, LacI family [Anaerocolumna sp.]